nr:tripartite tricarboxylate transporter substrate binding protein [Burkholderiales bacterium]
MTTSVRFRFSARRRRALLALAATGCGTWPALVAGPANAADPVPGAWPTRPIRLLCPLGAGTSADGVARLVARGLQDALGQNVIVENRPGAATNIASDLVARAPADGYTLLFGTSSLA